MNPSPLVHVIGGGLAGTEAAWQAARAGVQVVLHEMRPDRSTPAHHTAHLAELVCSNSFGARATDRAAGLLHEELRVLGSLILTTADQHAVPAGGALAVDRVHFGEALTRAVENHPAIQLRREEIAKIPDEGPVVLATGPLTADDLAADIQRLTGPRLPEFLRCGQPHRGGREPGPRCGVSRVALRSRGSRVPELSPEP